MSPGCPAPIAVVGGGPAGACAALRLADMGHDVVLVERRAFPRAHVGEALGPGVAAQLGFLGLGHVLDDCGGYRFAESRLKWAGDAWERRPLPPGAVTIDRARFDKALIEAARSRGVRVLQPLRARTAALFDREWRIDLEGEGGRSKLGASFLIDASGRSGFLGPKRHRTGPRTTALHAYWRGTGAPGPRVAAGTDHWFWASPVPGLGDHIMLFADSAALPRTRAGIDAYYRSAVAAASLGGDGAPLGAVRLSDADAYREEVLVAERFLRIGEAAFALDPLSSSGVQKAIATALLAAAAVNTILRRPADTALASDFYAAQAGEAVARHASWSGAVYAEHREHAGRAFWSARAAPAAPVAEPAPAAVAATDRLALSGQAGFRDVPVVRGDFVERAAALVHPGLDRPLAFFGRAEVAPLLRGLSGTPAEIERRFCRSLPPAASRALLARLAGCGALAAVAPGGNGPGEFPEQSSVQASHSLDRGRMDQWI